MHWKLLAPFAVPANFPVREAMLCNGSGANILNVCRGKLHATFIFSEDEIQAIHTQADQNARMSFDKRVDLLDQEGNVVATVVKTLYVRKKELITG